MMYNVGLEKTNGTERDLIAFPAGFNSPYKEFKIGSLIKNLIVSHNSHRGPYISGLSGYLPDAVRVDLEIEPTSDPKIGKIIIVKVKELARPKAIVAIEDLAAFNPRSTRKGTKRLTGGGKYIRKGHGDVEVIERHADDQKILLEIFGGEAILEENFVDIRKGNKIREYKPNTDSGDIDQALGKLIRAGRAYYRMTGEEPELGFITRRRQSEIVIEDFAYIGAKVEYLTKDNQLVPAN